MESKSFYWVLSEFAVKKIPLNILEVGLCRGNRLLSWFASDQSGILIQKSIKETNKTTFLLSYFASLRCFPNDEKRVICYLYHRAGIKIVTTKDSSELAENQFHGLHVKSVHLASNAAVNSFKAFRFEAFYENSSVASKLTYGRLNKLLNQETNNRIVHEKALSLVAYISELIFKYYLKKVKVIKLDLMADINGKLSIININELRLSESLILTERLLRAKDKGENLKFLESDSEESAKNTEKHKSLYQKPENERKTREKTERNSEKLGAFLMFYEMVAKTFDRERKALKNFEILKQSKLPNEKFYQNSSKKLKSLKKLNPEKLKTPKNESINTINELLNYVENTRPKIWVRDSGMLPHINDSISMNSPKAQKSFLTEPNEQISKTKNSSSAPSFTIENRHFNRVLKFLDQEEIRLRKKTSVKKLSRSSTPKKQAKKETRGESVKDSKKLHALSHRNSNCNFLFIRA